MSTPAAVDPGDVHAALSEVARGLVDLVRSIDDPTAHAIGSWNTVEVAVHLAHVWENLTALADDGLQSPLDDLGGLGPLTVALVEQDPDRDPEALAARIETRSTAFLSSSRSMTGGPAAPWLVEGIEVQRVTLACHILSESLVHGHDIARAQHAAWTIKPAHAGLALMGFAFPLLERLDPRALVDQAAARGLDACYELRVRGAGRVLLEISDGTVAFGGRDGRRVDCRLSADPATLLLLLFGRVSQWPALFTGRLVAWGRKPWLAPRLRQVLRNP